MKLLTSFKGSMPEGLFRVPHGWWKPEMARGGVMVGGVKGVGEWDWPTRQIEHSIAIQGIFLEWNIHPM